MTQCFIWLTKSATLPNAWRLQDLQVPQDTEDRKELKEIMGALALKVKGDDLEILVLKDPLDILVLKESLVSKEKREKLEHKEKRVLQE